MLDSGIPDSHNTFWQKTSLDGISSLYSLAVISVKVLKISSLTNMNTNDA